MVCVPRPSVIFGFLLLVVGGSSFVVGVTAQSEIEGGTFESDAGISIKVLFDGPSPDVPFDVGEIIFPPGTNTGEHPHRVAEIFYMLEGELEQVVNGESQFLGPGMFGFVTSKDLVNHVVASDGPPAKALIMFAPGGNYSTRLSLNRVE